MNVRQKSKIRKIIGILLIILFIIPLKTPIMKQYLSIPNEMITFQNDAPISLPQFGNAKISEHPLVSSDNTFQPTDTGKSSLTYKVANVPIKKMDIAVLEEQKIIPGGQSVGVQLHTLGVLVVGHHLVNNGNASQSNPTDSPGEEADIKVGDIILEMNGHEINHLDELKQIVQAAGKNKQNISVTLKRGRDMIQTQLRPTLNKQENDYQIGLYIRDSTTGIGTISFYDATTGKYGALGHVISDSETKKPIEIHNGKIVRSTVTAIERGNQGIPGEKQAKFSMKDQQLGTITKNSPFGIFGKINPTALSEHQKPLPIGLANEVKKGPAHILTVIEGEKVEKFDIEVVNTIPQTFPATKGMIIKVTDKRLLEKTGGIVQGMSGSPIIQDGKLIGAVTHVFVNDPTSGYGVHIEWMLQEADIHLHDKKLKTAI